MSSLLICSLEPYTGKTSVCLGLGLLMKEAGRTVSYMKPLGTIPTEANGVVCDEDTLFMREQFGMTSPLERVCPIVFTYRVAEGTVLEAKNDAAQAVRAAFDLLRGESATVLVEGGSDLIYGRFMGISPPQLAEKLDLPVLLVVRYSYPENLDQALAARDAFGGRLKGYIVNLMPESGEARFREEVEPFLREQGIPCFGTLRRDRKLMSVSVSDLAASLGGEILTADGEGGRLVESFMVGAMGQEQALHYFRQRSDKAVVTGGDRSDIILAALETPTSCLILTGDRFPSAAVIGRAEELGVPMMLVKHDTLTTIEKMEAVMGKVRMHDEVKVERLLDLMRPAVDLEAVLQGLGS